MSSDKSALQVVLDFIPVEYVPNVYEDDCYGVFAVIREGVVEGIFPEYIDAVELSDQLEAGDD